MNLAAYEILNTSILWYIKIMYGILLSLDKDKLLN